jgi:hypothetical protein
VTERLQSLRIQEAELQKTERDLVVSEYGAAGMHLRAVRQERGLISIRLGEVRREIIKLEKSAKRKSRAKVKV